MRGAVWLRAALVLAAAAQPAQAATIESYYTGADAGVIVISGKIIKGDSDQYLAARAGLHRRGAKVSFVALDSPGGDLDEAEAIDHQMSLDKPLAMVTAGRSCASACVLLLTAGSGLWVSSEARVGVHSVAEDGNGSSLGAMGYTTRLARMLSERAVPPNVLGQLVTTPPGSMYWLTADDIRHIGVSMGDMRLGANGLPTAAEPWQPAPGAQPFTVDFGTPAPRQVYGAPAARQPMYKPQVRCLSRDADANPHTKFVCN